MQMFSGDKANAPSYLSAKRLWWVLALVCLGLVVLVPIIAWKTVFETRPAEAELQAALAENAKHVMPRDELDHEAESELIQALSLDDLEQIAAEGEPVLYTFRGQSVTWQDMTGIPFAESLRIAREIDQSIPEAEHRRELSQLGNGTDLNPLVIGQMTPTATVGEYRINSQLFGHIQRGWAHCAGQTFVSDQAVDLTQRIDFAAADEAIARGNSISKEWLRFWETLADDLKVTRAEGFYDSSPLFQELMNRTEFNQLASRRLHSPLPVALKFQTALMPFGSNESPSPPMWFQYEWESCFHRIAAVDQAAIDPSMFVSMVEERDAPRDVIRFCYYAPHERATVEALVRSFLRPDRRVDVAKAEAFHRSRSAVSVAAFLITQTNAPIKEISTMQLPASTARSMWKGITPGNLFFERQVNSTSDYYGFVYLGEPLLGSSGKGHDPHADFTVRNDALNAIARDSWRKLKGDFQTNPQFSMTPPALTRRWSGWFHPPADWRSVKSPIVKELPAERATIDDVFKRLSPDLSVKFSNWKALEEHWHAGRWWAFRVLLEEEKKASGIKLDNEQELILMRWQHLPSVEFAPR